MAKNEVYRVGQYVPAPVPDTAPGTNLDLKTNSGVPLRLGILNVITVTQKGEDNYDQNASVDLGGAHLLDVVVTGGPAHFGDAVYIATDGKLHTDSAAAGAEFFGAILDDTPVANGTTPVIVKPIQTSA